MRRRIDRAVFRLAIVLLCLAVNSNTLAGERGAVTAIASLQSQSSAFVGFAAGDVLYCTRLSGCTALKGTPRSAVTAIDSPRASESIMVWVGYEDGTLYFCTLTGGCALQEQKISGRLTGGHSAGDPRIK